MKTSLRKFLSFVMVFFVALVCFFGVNVKAATTATITFDANKTQRTVFSTSQQVWQEGSITFTNNKSSSTSSVGDYGNPVRLYANSESVVQCANGTISEISFTCNNTSYATTLKNSITTSNDAVTVDSKVVTISFDTPVESYTIAKLTGQVRLNSLTVTYEETISSYTVDFVTNIEGVSLANQIITDENPLVVEPEVSAEGYIFQGWYVDAEFTNEFDFATEITENTTLYAKWEEANYKSFMDLKTKGSLKLSYSEVAGGTVASWELVEDAADLAAGDTIVIATAEANEKSGSYYALSTNQKTSNREGTTIEKIGDSISVGVNAQEITLEAGAVDGTFAFNVGNGYLYAASSSGNQLKTKTTLDVNGSWTITISDGVASVTATASSNRNVMQFNYNNGSPLFACYASATQSALAIYKLKEVEDPNATSYDCTNVAIRFGVVMDEEVYNKMLESAPTFGVSLTVNGKETTYDCDLAVVESNGETKYQFAVVINNIPTSNYATKITGKCYVVIEGEKHYMQECTWSVQSISAYYVSQIEAEVEGYTDLSEYLGVLTYLSK